jgi:hypothetical protein
MSSGSVGRSVAAFERSFVSRADQVFPAECGAKRIGALVAEAKM